MERRLTSNSHFVNLGYSNANTIHELMFSVRQQNLDKLEKLLVAASSPGSPSYQKWLTKSAIGSLTRNFEGSNALLKFLNGHGVKVTWSSSNHNYIRAESDINTWERLFNTTFYQWHHVSSDRGVFHRAMNYSLPDELMVHIEEVFNLVQTPSRLLRPATIRNNSAHPIEENVSNERLGRSISSFPPNIDWGLGSSNACNGEITVPCLNSIYKVNSNLGNEDISQAVFMTINQYFSQSDLATFQQKYDLTQQPALSPYGHTSDECVLPPDKGNDCSEGNLDIQYLMGMAQRTPTVYWYVSDEGPVDPFITWITDVSDDPNPPKVFSISLGAKESEMSSSIMKAFNVEAMKLANMGVTIIAASGDDGAAGFDCDCSTYSPSFPASSPYVTSVGATMGPENGQNEVTCQSDRGGLITTGGGFSKHFDTPSWQKSAVEGYFASLSGVNVPAVGFNRGGRGYPDVSLVGVDYQVVVGGTLANTFGTSASAPVFAAFVTLVNSARVTAGLPTIGFLNPTLYAIGTNSSSPYKFNDITEGDNRCCAGRKNTAKCCDLGFTAAPGWDPVTGWGSMNYDTFSAAFAVSTPYVAHIPKNGFQALMPSSAVIALSLVLVVLCLGSCCFGWRRIRQRRRPGQSAVHNHWLWSRRRTNTAAPRAPTVVDTYHTPVSPPLQQTYAFPTTATYYVSPSAPPAYSMA